VSAGESACACGHMSVCTCASSRWRHDHHHNNNHLNDQSLTYLGCGRSVHTYVSEVRTEFFSRP